MTINKNAEMDLDVSSQPPASGTGEVKKEASNTTAKNDKSDEGGEGRNVVKAAVQSVKNDLMEGGSLNQQAVLLRKKLSAEQRQAYAFLSQPDRLDVQNSGTEVELNQQILLCQTLLQVPGVLDIRDKKNHEQLAKGFLLSTVENKPDGLRVTKAWQAWQAWELSQKSKSEPSSSKNNQQEDSGSAPANTSSDGATPWVVVMILLGVIIVVAGLIFKWF